MAEPKTADPTLEEVDIFTLQALANETPDLISLGLGDPDSATPQHIIEAADRAIDEGRTGPAPTQGLIELRRAIASKLERENDVIVDAETEVLLTTGSQEALFLLIQSLVDPGDEVLVPDPRYPAYDAAINLAGGKIVLVPTDLEHDFALQAADIEAHLTERSKALLLITPSNPTAAVIPPDELRKIAELAIERDLIVISDEIYEHFLYDGAEHLSIGSLPGMRERTITLNGLSKAYAMTGWRVGYIAAPSEFIQAVASLKAMINVHAPTVSQWAAVAALEGPQDAVREMRDLYAHRRKVLMDGLKEMGFSFGSSQGAFYIWANISSTGMDAMQLSYFWLQNAAVMVFPGSGFGEKWSDYMRFTLLQPDDKMLQALERMDEALDKAR
ncbi:MAG: pyridoxal phosphate-dependent aminotransferase [Thermomicrobiales bacterium]